MRCTLTKSDQHPPLARNVFDAEACAPSIAPGGTAYGRKPPLRRQARDPFQVLSELLLFERQLRSRIQMLQRAAATDLKVRAARLHAIGGGRQHRLEPRLIVLTMATPASKADGLPGQRACHERGLTLANDAGTFVAQAHHHPGFLDVGGKRRTPAHVAGFQASRNWA
jgi:hypothetical protein